MEAVFWKNFLPFLYKMVYNTFYEFMTVGDHYAYSV